MGVDVDEEFAKKRHIRGDAEVTSYGPLRRSRAFTNAQWTQATTKTLYGFTPKYAPHPPPSEHTSSHTVPSSPSPLTSSRATRMACLAFTSASRTRYGNYRTTGPRSKAGSRSSSRAIRRPRCVACATRTPSSTPGSPPPPEKSRRSHGSAMRSCAS